MDINKRKKYINDIDELNSHVKLQKNMITNQRREYKNVYKCKSQVNM